MSWHRRQKDIKKRGRPRKKPSDPDLEYKKNRKESDRIAKHIEESWKDDFDEILENLEEDSDF